MTARAWLTGQLGSAAVFALPTLLLTAAGARHVAANGQSWLLYILTSSFFWGPGPLLALAVYLQSRPTMARMGWRMSVAAAVGMALWSVVALWSFASQGDVHWSLWTMWIAAAVGTVIALGGSFALAPSRRVGRGNIPPVAV
jgi:hypothetical protein